MKKLILVLLMAVVTSGSAWAQKGMMGVGANVIAHNTFQESHGLGVGGAVKFQYYISDYFRIEPSIGYYARASKKFTGTFNLNAMVNLHAFLMSPRSLRPYLFAGIGYLGYEGKESVTQMYTYWVDIYGVYEAYNDYYEAEEKYNRNGFGIDGGLGLDYRVSHNVSLQIEAGVIKGVKDEECFGLKANIGVCYNF